jgi:hypothetical protein
MRILLVEGSGRGFLSHYSHALAMGLHRAGAEVRLLTGRRDELCDWPVPFHKHACLATGYRAWRCVRTYVSESQPDVVHLQWVGNPVYALLFVRWAQRRGVRVVYTPHNILPHERRWILMPIFRQLYRSLDRVVTRDAHLAWALEELLDTPQDRLVHLPGSPNFLALQALGKPVSSPCEEKRLNELRLLFFGHGCRRKGLGELLATIGQQTWPDRLHLVIAGENVLQGVPPDLLNMARSAMRITVLDRYVAPIEVAGLFQDSDLLLMPYTKQCKSPLLDLAAALRLPVLRSDRVQGADFQEGVHGATFPHDDILAMCDWLKQPAWLKRTKRTLGLLEDPFASMDRLAEGHARLYQNLEVFPETTVGNGLAPAFTPR